MLIITNILMEFQFVFLFHKIKIWFKKKCNNYLHHIFLWYIGEESQMVPSVTGISLLQINPHWSVRDI